MAENADVSSETPPQSESPAAIAARDVLLSAIGREAEIVAKDQAGTASATLVELAHTYALVTGTTAVTPSGRSEIATWNANPDIDPLTYGDAEMTPPSTLYFLRVLRSSAPQTEPPAAAAAGKASRS